MRPETILTPTLTAYREFVLRQLHMDKSLVATLDATGSFSTDTPETRALLGALGLDGEAGEVTELHKKHFFHGKPMDREKLIHELGDVFWYFTLLLTQHDITLDEVVEANVQKLEARYGKR